MTAHLHNGPQPVADPYAVLNNPGLAIVYLTNGNSWLAFTEPGDARQLAAACERAAGLLEGPQVTEA